MDRQDRKTLVMPKKVTYSKKLKSNPRTRQNRKRNNYVKKTKKRIKHKLRIFMLSIFSVLVTVGILFSISVYKFLNAPFTSAAFPDQIEKDELWGAQTTIAILVIDDLNNKYSEINKLIIADFDDESKRYGLYVIPVGIESEYPLNYGSGPLSRVYAVGNSDNDRGLYLLQKVILKELAISIDGYIITDKSNVNELIKLTGDLNPQDLSTILRLKNTFKIPDMLSWIRNNSITNAKLSDIYNFASFIKNTSETSSYYVEISEEQMQNITKWDEIWQKQHQFNEIGKENVKVLIVNASEPKKAGLAAWGKRVATNLGAEVFDTINSEKPVAESMIITSNPELLTVQKFAYTLGIEEIATLDEVPEKQEMNPEIFRADISILLTDF